MLQSSKHFRMIARVSAAMLGATAILTFTHASTAHGFTSEYFGRVVAPLEHCNDSSGAHTWRYNEASYLGGGTLLAICDSLWNSGGERPGSRCLLEVNFDENCYGATSEFWHAYVYMNSFNKASHTIYGFADTAGCP